MLRHRCVLQTDRPIATDDALRGALAAVRGWWSHLTFDWVSPLLARGHARGALDGADLDALPLPDDCATAAVWTAFERCWEEERARAREGAKEEGGDGDGGAEDAPLLSAAADPPYRPSLVRALARAFGRDFLMAGALKLVHDVNIFVGPQVRGLRHGARGNVRRRTALTSAPLAAGVPSFRRS